MHKGWKASLASVLKEHNGRKLGGSVASYATQDKRADTLYAGFTELRKLGYKLDSVHSFKGKHMQALAKKWEERGLSASTLQNNISIFRTFANWIGKAGLVEKSDKYVSAGAANRSSVAKTDKSWQAQGVDVAAQISKATAIDPRVGLQLELQAAFGLRVREALELRPHIADKGAYLAVNVGTKGGRDRVVPIDTIEKRALIEKAKGFTANKTSSTSDPSLRLHQVKNRYYAVMRACGITKTQGGITSHGLRHGFANDRYSALSGRLSPVRGGSGDDKAARLAVAEDLGHSRESITTHYLGR